MRAKDMFLKKTNLIQIFFIVFIYTGSSYANNELNNSVITYMQELKDCSFSFLQNTDEEISEGSISIGLNRIRIDYQKPSRIIIILDETKGMYYNVDLDEDEFFNPKNTTASFFFEMFKNPDFLRNSNYSTKDKNIIIKSNGVIDDQNYKLEIYFENKPVVLRKIKFELSDILTTLSVFNYKKNENFNKNFFKLINPTFFN